MILDQAKLLKVMLGIRQTSLQIENHEDNFSVP